MEARKPSQRPRQTNKPSATLVGPFCGLTVVTTMQLYHPIDVVRVTQLFGKNPQIYKRFGMKGHNGIDWGTKTAKYPLGRVYFYPLARGKVTEVGYDPGGYGNYFRQVLEDGSTVVYGHAHKLYVKKGQIIDVWTKCGITGNTGFSTGAHLHIGLRPPDFLKIYGNGFKGYVDFYSRLTPRKPEWSK